MRNRTNNQTRGRADPWLRVAVAAAIVGLAVYSTWQRDRVGGPVEKPTASPTVDLPPVHAPTLDSPIAESPITESKPDVPANAHHEQRDTVIPRQTIRDQDGR